MALALALIAAVWLAIPVCLPWLISPDTFEKQVVQDIEKVTEGAFNFESAKVSYFPTISVTFNNTQLEINGGKFFLAAERVKLDMKKLALLFGRFEVAKFKAEKGEAVLRSTAEPWLGEIKVSNVSLNLKALRRQATYLVEFVGETLKVPKAVSGNARIQMSDLSSWNWRDLVLEGKIQLQDLELAAMLQQLKLRLPFELNEGNFSSGIIFTKKGGEDWIRFLNSIQISGLVYQKQKKEMLATSPKIDSEIKSEISWNPATDEWILKEGQLTLPWGRLESNGHFFAGTGEIREIRVSASGMALDEIPRYWFAISDSLPNNFGFSGPSDWDITMQGTWDHLTIHGNVDMTAAILTYARYFSKPKDIPMAVTFDALLKQGDFLESDFSVHCREALIKGTLSDFYFSTGVGQLNVITNKFAVAGLEDLLLPLTNYDLAGELKLLANWQGHLRDWQKSLKVFNATWEQGAITRRNGSAIKDIHFVMDYGQLAFMVKEASFKIGDFPVSVIFSIYNLLDAPAGKAQISSDRLAPGPVLNMLQDLTLEWLSAGAGLSLEHAKAWAVEMFPAAETVEKLDAEVEYRDRTWYLNHFRMNAYGGHVALSGEAVADPENASYRADLELNQWDLKRFLMRKGQEPSWADGTLFLNMHFSREGAGDPFDLSQIQGDGAFLVTNGAFQTFDLLEEVGKISELQKIATAGTGTTPFSDIRSEFQLRDGKIRMDKLLLINPDLYVMADGEAKLDGLLNHRLAVYLSADKTGQLLGDLISGAVMKGSVQFGPIPFLLTGAIQSPELQPDPQGLLELMDHLAHKRTHKILRDFLPEDLALNRDLASS